LLILAAGLALCLSAGCASWPPAPEYHMPKKNYFPNTGFPGP
jgi:hypothetical protein